jgi:two-component system, OmpR family, response regulator
MSEQTTGPSCWQMRILVVEDNETTAENLARLLRTAGHEVEIAPDGLAAMRAAENQPPDVVLLDIGLPDMGGWEVARELQALPAEKRPLLVAVTGYGQEEDHRRSYEAGIDLHLTKPIDPTQLQHLLRRFKSFVSPVGHG